MRTSRRSTRSGLNFRARLLALVAFVQAFAFISSIAHAGERYFYCHMMEAAQSHCCCPTVERDESDDGATPSLSAPRSSCCDARVHPSVPPASVVKASASQPAVTLPALLPSWPAIDVRFPASSATLSFGQLARPPPRASRERRAQLMVFLL
jgi:hypothetical protein